MKPATNALSDAKEDDGRRNPARMCAGFSRPFYNDRAIA
jgi:hypothetical protein